MNILHRIYLIALIIILSPLYVYLLSTVSIPWPIYLAVVINAVLLLWLFLISFQIGTVNGRTLERKSQEAAQSQHAAEMRGDPHNFK